MHFLLLTSRRRHWLRSLADGGIIVDPDTDYVWHPELPFALPTGLTYSALTGRVGGTVYDTKTPIQAVRTGGTVYHCTTHAEVQTAVNACVRGDYIVLDQNYVFTGGRIIIPSKSGTAEANGYIRIMSLADWNGLCPTSHGNERVAVGDTRLAKFACTVYEPQFETPRDQTGNASHGGYIFSNLEFTSADRSVHTFLGFGRIDDTLLTRPENFIVHRCYIHNAGYESLRGISAHAKNVAAVDCIIDDILADAESQAIMVHSSLENLKAVNCLLGASGENFMCGGAGFVDGADVSKHMEFRRNYFRKFQAWTAYGMKNLFETKAGTDIYLEDSILDGSWTDAQTGNGVLLKATDQTGLGIDSRQTMQRMMMRFCKVRNTDGSFSIAGNTGNALVSMRYLLLEHLILDDIHAAGGTGRNFMIQLAPSDSTIRNISGNPRTDAITISSALSEGSFNFKYNDNVLPYYGAYWIGGNGGNETLNNVFGSSWEVENNMTHKPNLSSLASVFSPTNKVYPTVAGMGLVDFAGRNYRLSDTSPMKGQGLYGNDPGANIDEVESRTSGCESGTWSTEAE